MTKRVVEITIPDLYKVLDNLHRVPIDIVSIVEKIVRRDLSRRESSGKAGGRPPKSVEEVERDIKEQRRMEELKKKKDEAESPNSVVRTKAGVTTAELFKEPIEVPELDSRAIKKMVDSADDKEALRQAKLAALRGVISGVDSKPVTPEIIEDDDEWFEEEERRRRIVPVDET